MRWRKAVKEIALAALVAVLGYCCSLFIAPHEEKASRDVSVDQTLSPMREIPPFAADSELEVRRYFARYLSEATAMHCHSWAELLLAGNKVSIPRLRLGKDPMKLSDPWVALLHRWTQLDSASADAFCRSTKNSALADFALYFRVFHDPGYRDFSLSQNRQLIILAALLRQHPAEGLALYQERYAGIHALDSEVTEAIALLAYTAPIDALQWNERLGLDAESDIIEVWSAHEPEVCLAWIMGSENADFRYDLLSDFVDCRDGNISLFLGVSGKLPRDQEFDELIMDSLGSVDSSEEAVVIIKEQFADDPLLKHRYLINILPHLSKDLAFALVCEMANDSRPVIQLGIKNDDEVKEFNDVNWHEEGPPDRTSENSFFVDQLLQELLAADPNSIRSYLDRLPSHAISFDGSCWFYFEWMKVHTDAALDYMIKNIDRIEPQLLQNLSLERYLLPQEYDSLIAKLPSQMQDAAMANRVSSLSRENWQAAWELVSDYKGDRSLAIKSLLGTMTAADAEYLPVLLPMLPEADEELWKQLELKTGAKVEEFLTKIPNGPVKDTALVHQLEVMPDRSGQYAQALEYAAEMQNPAMRSQSIEKIYRSFRADLKRFYDPAAREHFLLELNAIGINGAASEQWKSRMEDDCR